MDCSYCKQYECVCVVTDDDVLHEQLKEAHEFILKTAGKSKDRRYTKDPDYWHDIGWEKDLQEYTKKYAR